MSQEQAATRSGIPSRSEAGREAMNCLIGKDLERALASRRGKFLEARSAAYYRVTTELAAQKNVDMERAKSDLEEHQFVCKACEKVYVYSHRTLPMLPESRAVPADSRQFLDKASELPWAGLVEELFNAKKTRKS